MLHVVRIRFNSAGPQWRSAHVDVGSQKQRQLRGGAAGLQNAERLTSVLQDWPFALRQRRGSPGAGAFAGDVGHGVHQTPEALLRELKLASGPVTGISTLAAWLIQSVKSSVVGRRWAIGWVNRNTEDAPPLQLGLTRRARLGAGLVCVVFAVRLRVMATTSFCVLSRALPEINWGGGDPDAVPA
jgi:hypothetical protein